MPSVGFGVYKLEEGKEAYDAVRFALDAGYRYIDAASYYGNEKSVGKAIKESGIDRSEIFLLSKVWNDEVMAGKTKESLEASLERLQTDYLDCFLVHWPVEGYRQAWKDLIDVYQHSDVLRSIGVSNFEPRHLDKLDPSVLPVINQIESHPRLCNQTMIEEIQKRHIPVSAYRPLGGWRPEDSVLTEAPIVKLAEQYGKTPAQIVLRWHLQRGLIPVAKSAKKERIESNFQIFDFMLTGADMKIIEDMNSNRSTVNVMNPVAD